MTQALHSRARTTHLIREEIKNSTLSQAELARLYNVSRQTIRKWQDRDSVGDASHRPNTMHTTLTPEQELVVVELRRTLLLPTDDLLSVTREFINPAVSRAGLGRCLRHHGVSSLLELASLESDKPVTKKSFKDYEPGFLHMDIKYLPQMPDETERRYLFVAIVKLLTDNGSQFTDRFTSKQKDPETGDRIPSGKHAFDVLCKHLAIEHRLIPPRHPQTNGMVERFNGRISELVNQTRFASRSELESTLCNYLKIYNHNIPQRALNNETPVQAMKKWQAEKPELFVKRVYNQAGLDT